MLLLDRISKESNGEEEKTYEFQILLMFHKILKFVAIELKIFHLSNHLLQHQVYQTFEML